ncbi:MAG: RnfABCDGE type electron transport complex subunit D [DPANN group archaeon]|nr:RnfABCDGE type electron transport complex subunit D [DPANN group archaeon]
MAYIEKRKIKGRRYYYLKESKRKGGEVKTRTIEYLGKDIGTARAKEAIFEAEHRPFDVIRNFFSDVYNLMILAMVIITIVSAYFSKSQQIVMAAVIAIATAVILDAAINYVKHKNFDFYWKSPIVTGFIITLVLSANKLYIVAIAAALAIALKHIIRAHNKHIFNPANLALAIVPFFLPASHGWQGSVIWWLPVILGFIVIYKLRRLELPITFLLTYILLTAVFNFPSQIIDFLVAQSAAYFFGFFMLTEPKTSPDTQKGRIIFGIIAAAAAVAFSFFLPQYNLVLGLVAADMLVPVINKFF